MCMCKQHESLPQAYSAIAGIRVYSCKGEDKVPKRGKCNCQISAESIPETKEVECDGSGNGENEKEDERQVSARRWVSALHNRKIRKETGARIRFFFKCVFSQC